MPCTICHQRTPRRFGSAARTLRRADPQLRPKPAKDAGYYFNARWYNAERGSFIGRDPKLQYWSPYAYVGNKPLISIDPTGLEEYYLIVNIGKETNRAKNYYADQARKLKSEIESNGFSVSLRLDAGVADFKDALNDMQARHVFVMTHGDPETGQVVLRDGFVDPKSINDFEWGTGFSASNTDVDIGLYACSLGNYLKNWQEKLPNVHAPFVKLTKGMKAFDQLKVDASAAVQKDLAARADDPLNSILDKYK